MSFATSIGHTFTGAVGHRGRGHLARPRTTAPDLTPAPAPEPRHVRSTVAVDTAVADHRQDLEQWSRAFTLATGLNR